MSQPVCDNDDPYLPWVFKLFKDCDCHHPIGTGFLLSNKHVATCHHVYEMKQNDSLYLAIESPGGKSPEVSQRSNSLLEAIKLQLISADANQDLAVLELEREIGGLVSFPKLVEGVTDEFYTKLLTGNSSCFGGLGRTWERLEQILSIGSDHIQFSGGPKPGFSGSPVLLKEFPTSGIFGMMQQGGQNSGHCRALTSQKIIKFARNCIGSNFSSVKLIEMLRHIVGGKDAHNTSVIDDWYSKWDYAKNTDGVYIDINGNEITDSTGKKLLNYHQDKNLLVKNGINTGSLAYAEIFNGNADR